MPMFCLFSAGSRLFMAGPISLKDLDTLITVI